MTMTRPYAGFRQAQWHSIDTYNSGHHKIVVTTTTTTLPANDTVLYVPIRVRFAIVVRKLFIVSGSTGTGNYDLGLYDAAGTRLVSKGGTNAKPASAVEAVLDVTDTTITPGLYYMAMVGSNTTDTWGGMVPSAPIPAATGILTEVAGSTAVPATATWSVGQTIAYYPYMGILTTTVVS